MRRLRPSTSPNTRKGVTAGSVALLSSFSRHLWVVATVVAVLVVWQIVALILDTHYILPSPIAVARVPVDGDLGSRILGDLSKSLTRALIGYSLAAVIAIPLGMLAGWWKVIDNTVGSFIELLRPIPALALIPLAIVWLGFGEFSKVTLIAYACFFSIYINTHAGVRNIDPMFIRVMQVYGRGNWDIFTKVVLYAMLPYTFTGLRYAAAISLILLVAVEIIGANDGLGFALVRAQQFVLTEQIFFIIATFGVIGFVFNNLVLLAERRIIRWRQAVGAEAQ